MTAAAIYARVSSARQAKDETIGSQLSALREHAATSRLDVPEEWVFAGDGHSGATLARPALEALRDLAAQGCLDVVLVYSPDRLARKFAYQALLTEELARSGVRVESVKGPRGDSPEDQLLVQFQGMFAEYEKAQLMERYRRGKAWRAKTGSVNVLGGAPFGYRYVRKTPGSGARYEVGLRAGPASVAGETSAPCRASPVTSEFMLRPATNRSVNSIAVNPFVNRPLPIAFGGPGAVTVAGTRQEQTRRYRRRQCAATRTMTRQSSSSVT